MCFCLCVSVRFCWCVSVLVWGGGGNSKLFSYQPSDPTLSLGAKELHALPFWQLLPYLLGLMTGLAFCSSQTNLSFNSLLDSLGVRQDRITHIKSDVGNSSKVIGRLNVMTYTW